MNTATPRIVIFFFTLLFLQSGFALQIKVQNIHDGDTLNAISLEDSSRLKIRLMGVDTPEVDFLNMSQGDVALAARDFLASMIPEDGIVTLSEDSQIDKHGRILGRILVGKVDLNQEMLRNGWGYIYFIYPFEKRIVSDYSQAAYQAYKNKSGVFSDQYSDTEAPYLFRMAVQNQVGRNPIGDLQTKKLHTPDQINQVPVWRRVFFPSVDLARKNGYQ